MKRLILHIGMHKTGTTSIQETFYYNSRYLDGLGVRYPTFSANHSHIVYMALSLNGAKYARRHLNITSIKAVETLKEESMDTLITAFGSLEKGSLVISAEELSNLKINGITRLKNIAEKYFDDIHVVGYVRPPLQWLSSVIPGQVRRGKTLSRLYAKPPLPKYKSRFKPFIDVFPGKVTLHLFERNSLYNKCVIADFIKQIGLREADYAMLNKPRIVHNKGLSSFAVSLLDIFNRFALIVGLNEQLAAKARLSLYKSLVLLPGKYSLPERVAAKYQANNAADWQWVRGVLTS